MTFAIYGFCSDETPSMSIASLADELRTYFRNEVDFRIEFEQLPFEEEESLALFWGNWPVRISYEVGESVEDEVKGAQPHGTTAHAVRLASVNRMIRALFPPDNDQTHTNQIIYVLEFLKNAKHAILYDPQQKSFVDEI